MSKSAILPIQHPVQWILGTPSSGVKWLGHEGDLSSPSSSKVKNAYNSIFQYIFRVWCWFFKHRVTFIFTFISVSVHLYLLNYPKCSISWLFQENLHVVLLLIRKKQCLFCVMKPLRMWGSKFHVFLITSLSCKHSLYILCPFPVNDTWQIHRTIFCDVYCLLSVLVVLFLSYSTDSFHHCSFWHFYSERRYNAVTLNFRTCWLL